MKFADVVWKTKEGKYPIAKNTASFTVNGVELVEYMKGFSANVEDDGTGIMYVTVTFFARFRHEFDEQVRYEFYGPTWAVIDPDTGKVVDSG